MLLVIVVKDMAGLADLYAVGVVGAIATNLGATSTDRKLSIKTWERDSDVRHLRRHGGDRVSLLIDKPNARYFAVTILAVGLILRGLVQERRMKKEAAARTVQRQRRSTANPRLGVDRTAKQCSARIRGPGRTLDFALREARETGRRLYLLFVREQRFMTEQDAKRKWQEDPEAQRDLREAPKRARRIIRRSFATR